MTLKGYKALWNGMLQAISGHLGNGERYGLGYY